MKRMIILFLINVDGLFSCLFYLFGVGMSGFCDSYDIMLCYRL